MNFKGADQILVSSFLILLTTTKEAIAHTLGFTGIVSDSLMGAGRQPCIAYCLKRGAINDFIDRLDAESWNEIRQSISEKDDVQLRLTRFKWNMALRT
jgi:hypothetical protein